MFFVCLQGSASVLQAAAVIAYLSFLLLLLILESAFLLRNLVPLWFVVET